MVNGRTIREAIMLSLEGLNGTPEESLLTHGLSKKAVREHVRVWVTEYAKARGVILEDNDICDELDVMIKELREKAKL